MALFFISNYQFDLKMRFDIGYFNYLFEFEKNIFNLNKNNNNKNL